MKLQCSLIFAVTLLVQASAEVTPPPVVEVKEETLRTIPAPHAATQTTVVETVTPARAGQRRLDFDMAQRQLSIVPKALPVPEVRGTPPPGTKVETTETTTTVKVPGMPARTYNSERSVVVVEGRELPYVTIPVLFVKESDELLDADSALALQDTAKAIREVARTTPTAVFDIEGHTSTDGDAEMNMNLSALRARKVFDELTSHYMIPATALSAHGYGENYPQYPQGNEAQMMLDRRVLVVRVK